MAKLKIIREGDQTLRKTSREVDKITPRVRQLIGDMIDTLHDADGCGLAAVQVGVLRRIVIVEIEPDKPIILINPEIVSREGYQNNLEGCLSIPGEWGLTERPQTVTVKATGIDGKEFTVTGSDLAARAFCHEIDHLDGILFKDHAKMLTPEEVEALRSGDGEDE